MGEAVEKAKKDRAVLMLPVAEILPSENPREEYDPRAMAELMASMKHQGLLQPVGVRVLSTGKYKLIYGSRRVLAAKKLGWDTVEAIVVNVDDEKDALLKTSSENVIRENVSLPENGRLYALLLKKGMTAEQIAVRQGCSKQFVLRAIEAFQRIPKKYHDKITYGTRGSMAKPGEIPATVALAAVEVQNKTGLTKDDLGRLMEWAAHTNANSIKMKTAGRLIASGEKLDAVTKKVDYIKTITLTLTMKIDTINRLQTKHGKGINEILYRYLEDEEEFGIIPINPDRGSRLGKGGETTGRVIRRRKKAGRNR